MQQEHVAVTSFAGEPLVVRTVEEARYQAICSLPWLSELSVRWHTRFVFGRFQKPSLESDVWFIRIELPLVFRGARHLLVVLPDTRDVQVPSCWVLHNVDCVTELGFRANRTSPQQVTGFG